jgi:hypothetical protein
MSAAIPPLSIYTFMACLRTALRFAYHLELCQQLQMVVNIHIIESYMQIELYNKLW